MNAFRDVIEYCNLLDPGYTRDDFTCLRKVSCRPRTLMFEQNWTKFEECKDIVDDTDATVYCNKLKICLKEMDKWNRRHLGGSIKGAITRKEEDIRNLEMRKHENWYTNGLKQTKSWITF